MMTTTLKMKTTIIKTVTFFIVINMIYSCSNNKNNNANTAASPLKNTDTLVISGTVKSLTFGKDGYTSDVQTAKEGTFAALVSIVNVGGQNNYKTCEVGDAGWIGGIHTPKINCQ